MISYVLGLLLLLAALYWYEGGNIEQFTKAVINTDHCSGRSSYPRYMTLSKNLLPDKQMDDPITMDMWYNGNWGSTDYGLTLGAGAYTEYDNNLGNNKGEYPLNPTFRTGTQNVKESIVKTTELPCFF